MKNNHLSGPVKVTKNTEKLATKLIHEILNLLIKSTYKTYYKE